MNLTLSDLARTSEHLITNGLTNPGPLTMALVFTGGLLTSLGPCSISLLPITLAYLAGFDSKESPLKRSLSFSGGIVLSLICLGSLSGLLGKIYGQVPTFVPTLVAVLAVLMGLNLLGILQIPLPAGPDPEIWRKKVPTPLAPIAAGLAFGLASSPCTTPVLAVLLAWIAQSGSPIVGILLLFCFGAGQVIPLLIAGTAAASIPSFLAIKPIAKWIPLCSGMVLLSTGFLTLIARWI